MLKKKFLPKGTPMSSELINVHLFPGRRRESFITSSSLRRCRRAITPRRPYAIHFMLRPAPGHLPTCSFLTGLHPNFFLPVINRRSVPGSEHCPYDYIRIYDGKDEHSPVIGTFCGMGKFPYSIIGTSQDLFVEFVSSAAGRKRSTVLQTRIFTSEY